MRIQATGLGDQTGMLPLKEIVDELPITPGSELDLTITDGEIRVRPVRNRSRLLLEAMVAEAKRLGPGHEPETVEWGPDRGSEIIDDAYSLGDITLDDILNGTAARGR